MKTSMNDIEKAKEILNQYNQCHVASLFDKIDKAKQEELAKQVLNIDFHKIVELYDNTKKEIEIKDKEIKQLWDDFRQLNCVYKGKNKEFFCKQIPAKKRYIDVYVENKGRISKINKEMAQEIQMFLATDLSEYLWGKCE